MAKRYVGKYVCDEGNDLGQGSFGKVFLGHHRRDEKKMVAIKAINLNSSAVRRAGTITTEREVEIAEILTSTKHPNLILFLYHKKILSVIYLVMEFCDGGNLKEYLDAQERKTLSESTIRCFFKQIGAGLKFLHGKDIVHRDLKPENVLLIVDGPKYPTPENIRLKIGDFGLGRILTPEERAITDCGTLYYKAPEVASQNYDHKADLWSIGIMIYECVVGTVKAGVSDGVTLSRGTQDLTQDLKELLDGLLEKDPEKRFDCDRLMNHSFMLETIQLSINADGKTRKLQIMNSKANARRIAFIESCFGSSGQALAIPNRLLVGEGVLTKMCRKKLKPRQFFLFSDILVYGNIRRKGEYNKQRIIQLENVKILSVPDDGVLCNGWQIISPGKSFTVYGATAAEKDEWMAHINKCVQDLIAKYGRKSMLATTDPSPVWVPDSDASTCMCCRKSEFSLVNRRHHCRKCGVVCCDACTSRRWMFPHQSAKPQRICSACYNKLSLSGDANLGQGSALNKSSGEESSGEDSSDSEAETASNGPEIEQLTIYEL